MTCHRVHTGGGVLDLSSFIKETPEYRDSDIFAGIRKYSLTYGSGTQLVPFDADWLSVLVLDSLQQREGCEKCEA